jgi:RNA polymerase sigma-70 factor (ECF subfamily)
MRGNGQINAPPFRFNPAFRARVISSAIMYNDERSSEELFALIQQGDHSDDLAKDVVNRLFEKLWRNRQKIQLRSDVNAYLVSAVRNEAKNLIRREERRTGGLLDHGDLNGYEIAVDTPGTPQLLENRELLCDVQQEVASLPDQQREVFRLFAFEGLSYREIAHRLGISPHTIKNHILKAREQLRKRLP